MVESLITSNTSLFQAKKEVTPGAWGLYPAIYEVFRVSVATWDASCFDSVNLEDGRTILKVSLTREG